MVLKCTISTSSVNTLSSLELELKGNRRNESVKQYGGIHCWVGWCCGDDDINHIMKCEGYNTKPPRDDKGDEKVIADYLIELNSERIRRWGCPLIYIRGFWTREQPEWRHLQEVMLWNLGPVWIPKTIKPKWSLSQGKIVIVNFELLNIENWILIFTDSRRLLLMNIIKVPINISIYILQIRFEIRFRISF